jgi:hypothetical protein
MAFTPLHNTAQLQEQTRSIRNTVGHMNRMKRVTHPDMKVNYQIRYETFYLCLYERGAIKKHTRL